MHNTHEADATVTRRLEAFSDVVIGISLAQIALNLVIPQHAALFVTRPAGIVAFLVTFAVVASFWWIHGIIFRCFFVPNRVMIVLNFVALAAIVLQVFSLQLWMHFTDHADSIDAAKIYFGVFSITFATLALLFGLGSAYRWRSLSLDLRIDGVRRTLRVGCVAVGTAAGVALASSGAAAHAADAQVTVKVGASQVNVMFVPGAIFLGAAAGAIAGRIAAALATRGLRRPPVRSVPEH